MAEWGETPPIHRMLAAKWGYASAGARGTAAAAAEPPEDPVTLASQLPPDPMTLPPGDLSIGSGGRPFPRPT